MSKNVFFGWALVMDYMLQFLKCLNVANGIACFLSGQEINQYSSLCSLLLYQMRVWFIISAKLESDASDSRFDCVGHT
jgi:hypothetical protein